MVVYNGKPILEGIDKITVILHPSLRDFITVKHIDPTGKLQIRAITYWNKKYQKDCVNYYYLDIQAEYIDLEKDLREVTAHAVYELIKNNVIFISNNTEKQKQDEIFRYKSILHDSDTEKERHQKIMDELGKNEINYNPYIDYDFVYIHLDFFISRVKEIELFFDLKPESIIIPERTFLTESLGIIEYKETMYSNDYRKGRRKSILIKYDRPVHLLINNNIPHDVINNFPYKHRIEFRLNLNNRGIRVLPLVPHGTYEMFINEINDFLAVVYKQHFLQNMTINSEEHPHLNQIIDTAQSYPYSTYRGLIHKVQPETGLGYEDGYVISRNQLFRNRFNRLILDIETYISKKNTPLDKSKRLNRWKIMQDYYDYVKYGFVSDSEGDTNLLQETHDDILDDLLNI
ncbi:hypothetical protein AGMMS49579_23090 [Spirochaetia bacterium]|nr:hypothetical protein AGMMS49579_23090 [Spirochaetia bacterium]